MRINNPPNPPISTSLLSTVGMKPTRAAAIVFILPFPITADAARPCPRPPGHRELAQKGDPRTPLRDCRGSCIVHQRARRNKDTALGCRSLGEVPAIQGGVH